MLFDLKGLRITAKTKNRVFASFNIYLSENHEKIHFRETLAFKLFLQIFFIYKNPVYISKQKSQNSTRMFVIVVVSYSAVVEACDMCIYVIKSLKFRVWPVEPLYGWSHISPLMLRSRSTLQMIVAIVNYFLRNAHCLMCNVFLV